MWTSVCAINLAINNNGSGIESIQITEHIIRAGQSKRLPVHELEWNESEIGQVDYF